MTLLELLQRASDSECGNAHEALGRFVVQALTATFEPDADDEEQIATAATVMQRAADELADVAGALSDLLRVDAAA